MLLFKHVSRPRQLVSLVQLWEKSGTEFVLHQVWILFSFYLASPSKHTKMWIVPPNQKGSFWMLQARSPQRQVFFSRVKVPKYISAGWLWKQGGSRWLLVHSPCTAAEAQDLQATFLFFFIRMCPCNTVAHVIFLFCL